VRLEDEGVRVDPIMAGTLDVVEASEGGGARGIDPPLPGVWAVGVTGRHEPGGVGDEGKLCGGICQQQGIINEDVGLLANGEGMLWEVRPTGGHV